MVCEFRINHWISCLIAAHSTSDLFQSFPIMLCYYGIRRAGLSWATRSTCAALTEMLGDYRMSRQLYSVFTRGALSAALGCVSLTGAGPMFSKNTDDMSADGAPLPFPTKPWLL